jgi:hypothetical protein
MSFPGPTRGRGSDPRNGGVVMSAGRGAVLVALAILAGVLVLTVVNDRGSGTAAPPVVTETTSPTVPVTNIDGTVVTTPPATALDGTPLITTKKKKKSTTTTVAAVKGARPNDQVVVQVLNGSGTQNAATSRSNDLRAQGYQTVDPRNAPSQRTGTGVQCKADYEKEAQVLVNTLQVLGVPSAVEEVSNPLPTGFDASANCYVLLGK